jgi:hypothetical protein
MQRKITIEQKWHQQSEAAKRLKNFRTATRAMLSLGRPVSWRPPLR